MDTSITAKLIFPGFFKFGRFLSRETDIITQNTQDRNQKIEVYEKKIEKNINLLAFEDKLSRFNGFILIGEKLFINNKLMIIFGYKKKRPSFKEQQRRSNPYFKTYDSLEHKQVIQLFKEIRYIYPKTEIKLYYKSSINLTK